MTISALHSSYDRTSPPAAADSADYRDQGTNAKRPAAPT